MNSEVSIALPTNQSWRREQDNIKKDLLREYSAS